MTTKNWLGVLLLTFTATAFPQVRPERASAVLAQPGKAIRLQAEEFAPVGDLDANLERLRTAKPGHAKLHVIVQFDDLPSQAERQKLEAQGVRLLQYLPDHAYFASVADRTTAAQLQGKIRWLGGLAVADKLPPRVRQGGVGQWAKRADGSVDLRIKVFGDVEPATMTPAIEALGGRVLKVEAELRRLTVNLPAEKLELLADDDSVCWIEDVPPPPTTNNDGARVNIQASLLESAPYNLTGAAVALGEWDEAHVDPGHDDFAGRLITGDTAGTSSHSTHVGGTMAGNGTLSAAAGGTAFQWRGMAPAATIVTHDWFSNITEHNTAINTHGIVLSQNSWMYTISGGNCALYGDYSTDAPEYDQIVTGLYGRGINIIFAAGNERDDGDCHLTNGAPSYLNYRCVGPPATAKNTLSIGGTVSLSTVVKKASDSFDWEATFDGGAYWGSCGSSGAHKIYFTHATPIVTPLYDLALHKACEYVDGDANVAAKLNTGIQVAIQYDSTESNPTHPLQIFSVGRAQCSGNAKLLQYLARSIGMAASVKYYWGGTATHGYLYDFSSGKATFRLNAELEDWELPKPHYLFHAQTVIGGTNYDPSYGTVGPPDVIEMEPGASLQSGVVVPAPSYDTGWSCPH